jgi:ribosomal protein S17E
LVLDNIGNVPKKAILNIIATYITNVIYLYNIEKLKKNIYTDKYPIYGKW